MRLLIAFIIFSILVIFHEFGHFIVAKLNGVVVNEFSVGMGPRLFSIERGGTRYSLKLFPLGGSCAMLGEDEDDVQEGSFNSKSVWARIAIVFAGPLFNFILALLFAVIIVGTTGAKVSYVSRISEESPAYEAGMREGDRILKYNGAHAVIADEISLEDYINPLDGSEMSVVYTRDGKKYTATYKPEKKYMIGIVYDINNAKISEVVEGGAMDKAGAKQGDILVRVADVDVTSGEDFSNYVDSHPWNEEEEIITVKRGSEKIELKVKPEMSNSYSPGFIVNQNREKQNILGVVKYSITEVRYNVSMVIKSLGMLVTGKVSTNEMSGPVGIVDGIGTIYDNVKPAGIMYVILTMMNLAIMLSANLGVMNLLPIPALDGGRLLFYAIEVVRKKPMDRDKEGFVHLIGFAFLMLLMLFLVINDVRKIIGI